MSYPISCSRCEAFPSSRDCGGMAGARPGSIQEAASAAQARMDCSWRDLGGAGLHRVQESLAGHGHPGPFSDATEPTAEAMNRSVKPATSAMAKMTAFLFVFTRRRPDCRNG